MHTVEQTAIGAAPVIELFGTTQTNAPLSRVARLWRKAVHGNTAAQYNLGLAHMRGRVVTRNYREGVKWLRRAAEQGHPGGQHNLGVAYALGTGVTRSAMQAYKWFSLASNAGDERATDYLGRIARTMSRDEIEYAELMAGRWRPV